MSLRSKPPSFIGMPIAPIDNQGHHLYYEDTGPPPDAHLYTTLVIVHGTAFHAGRRLLPVLATCL